MAGSFREGAGPGDAHAPPPLSQFLALDALPSWGSDPKQPHWRHPELRRALASDDQADELRRIRASLQDSAGKAKEKVRSLHECIQKLDKYKNIVTRKRQRATDDARICDKLNNSRVAPEIMSLELSKKITKNHGEFSSCDTLESMSQHGSSGPRNLPLEYLRNITNNFSDDRLLGGGAFGTVYKGLLPNGETVAVKKLHSSILPEVKDKQFENEAYHLMRLKHPNILLLVGWCSETENTYVEYNGKYICAEKLERLLCLEYMPKGNLRTYLSDEFSGLTWETRYKIIEGVCYGLHYLHEGRQLNAPIVHMDLKPANILLDNNMMPKIADFGLSRLFNEEKTWTCTISRDGTLGYMAPEYINRGLISTNSDIFSLGVIIIEIVTGQRDYPYESETGVSSQEFTDLVLKKWRHRLQKSMRYTSLEIDCQQIVRCIQIGLDCVNTDRLKRPTISQVIKMLHETESAVQSQRTLILGQCVHDNQMGAFLTRAPAMSDLASACKVYACKDKLAYFRIKELKDILNQLGLPKQGKKQDLVDRVLAILSDEQGQRHHGWGRRNALTREAVAKVVDDTYRKMQLCPPDLPSRSHSGSDFSHFRPKEEATDFYHVETKVRCLCNSTMLVGNMIKCEDVKCQVWQHITCVLIPDKPTEGADPDIPPHFYCELCRLNRADPFWVTTGNPLLPVKFMSSGVGNDGASVPQIVEKTFQLSRADRETVQRPEYDLQVWCILINDKVQFRMQWPQYAELQVNGIPVRVMTRPGSQLLGINGRDDGPLVTTCSREGINKISLSRVDARTFCFGVRIVRRRTVRQVLDLIPKEGEGESFEDALARVRRCLGGGGATDNADDSDSDLEVVTESVTVNLRCPNSGSRMRTAGRFKPCVHMGCFDLETFVELNQRLRKWQCPICLKNYSLENLMIDPYFNRITSLLRNCNEDVNELDVKPDGSWRVKGDAATRDLSQWHMPDGTLCDSKEDTNPGVTSVNEFKREGTSDGHRTLKLGIKKTPHGTWQVSSKADDKKPVVRNHVQNNNGFSTPNIVSSPTGSYRDGDDASVNQEGGGIQFDIALNQEFDSFAHNFGQTYNTEDRQQQPQHNAADVIVLSDSDEENDPIVRPPPVYANPPTNGDSFPFITDAGSGYPERYQEDAGVGTSGLGLLSNNTGDFEINNWQMHSYAQPEQGFQFFGTDTDVGNPFVGPHNSFNIATEDYSLDCNVGIEDPSAAHDVSICRNSNDVHGSLVDNPLALAGDDPSLQIFLPSQPSTVPLQELSERANTPNGVHPDDWRISLTLAAGGGGNEESTSVDGLRSQPKVPSKEAGVEPLLDAASALPSMNNDRCNGSNLNPRRIENIFSHPRQPRSVRPRLCLSLDTDSE